MLSRRRVLPALLLTLFGIVFAGLALPSPATAGTTILCRGFSDCNAKGYGNVGYQNNYLRMWWRMYGGHNCTNYAAYRMIHAGMSSTRPWSGSGNASNWGIALSQYTNSTPMVGSVAWWRSRNHVQYVEQVVDANTIIVSEDHWGGDFDWARVQRGSSSWPDGFIHLRDVKITNTARPTVTGTPTFGNTLHVQPGSWSVEPASYFYRWYVDGKAVVDAQTFTPTADQVGKSITVAVAARRLGYLAGRGVSRAVTLAPARFALQQPATVQGVARVGGTLTATAPAWSPTPRTVTLQWFADGAKIPGATSPTLALGPELLGKRITVTYSASTPGFTATTSTSEPTDAVSPETLQVTEKPSLTGAPYYGRTYRVDPGTVTTPGARMRVTWLRDGRAISGTSLTRTMGAADLGHELGARVEWAKPGYRTVAATMKKAGLVRSVPGVRSASLRPRSITVKVVAKGVPDVTGRVEISLGTRTATMWLRDGKAIFQPSWMPAGTHTFKIHFFRTTTLTGAAVTRSITVLR